METWAYGGISEGPEGGEGPGLAPVTGKQPNLV